MCPPRSQPRESSFLCIGRRPPTPPLGNCSLNPRQLKAMVKACSKCLDGRDRLQGRRAQGGAPNSSCRKSICKAGPPDQAGDIRQTGARIGGEAAIGHLSSFREEHTNRPLCGWSKLGGKGGRLIGWARKGCGGGRRETLGGTWSLILPVWGPQEILLKDPLRQRELPE